MTVKDVVKVQATLIGREDVVKYLSGELDNADTATLNAVDIMTRCVNLTVSELAFSHIPMTKTYEVDGTEIVFKDVPDRLLRIVSVTDKRGNNVEYEYSPEKLSAKKSGLIFTYNYLPKNYQIDDQIEYAEEVLPLRVIAYGSLAEYLLTQRAFDESVMWRNRFVSELTLLLTPKNSKIKERRWC